VRRCSRFCWPFFLLLSSLFEYSHGELSHCVRIPINKIYIYVCMYIYIYIYIHIELRRRPQLWHPARIPSTHPRPAMQSAATASSKGCIRRCFLVVGVGVLHAIHLIRRPPCNELVTVNKACVLPLGIAVVISVSSLDHSPLWFRMSTLARFSAR